MERKVISLNSASLLNKTLGEWKQKKQQYHEVRMYKLSAVPKKSGELQIVLNIETKLNFNSNLFTVAVSSKPFYTTTLGIGTINSNYNLEDDQLKQVMCDLDEEFERAIAIEKSRHTPQNDI